jgi:hypothetical protein
VELSVFLLKDFAKEKAQNDHLVNTLKRANLFKLHEDFLDKVFGA